MQEDNMPTPAIHSPNTTASSILPTMGIKLAASTQQQKQKKPPNPRCLYSINKNIRPLCY